MKQTFLLQPKIEKDLTITAPQRKSMFADASSKKGVTRRGFLTVAVSAIVAGVVAGVGSYYAGSSAAPVKEVTTTLERTVRETVTTTLAPGAPVTTTVTTTITPPPVTTTVTRTVTEPTKPLLEGQVIKVGHVQSLTGALATFGERMKRGLDLAVEVINAAGGILGGRLEVVVEDDKGDPKISSSATEKLVTVDNVLAVLGGFSSSCTATATTVTEKYKVPFLHTGGVAEFLMERGFKYEFRINRAARVFAIAGFTFVERVLKPPKSVFIIHEDSAMGTDMAERSAAFVNERGWKLLGVEKYNAAATIDFTPIALKLKAAEPEMIVLHAYFLDAVKLLEQSKDIYQPKWWIALGGAGLVLPDVIEKLGPIAEGIFTVSEWANDWPIPEVQEFVTKFRAKYGYDPVMWEALAYSATLTLAEAIRRAAESGPLTRESLRDSLARLNFVLPVWGPIKFDEKGANPDYYTVSLVPYHQVQRGKWVTVWTGVTGYPRAAEPNLTPYNQIPK